MAVSGTEAAWKLTFQLSPVILVGGIATSHIGGYLPIIAISELINFPAGLLSGMEASLDNFFLNFKPVPGGSVIDQEIARYPFASQQVAANATVTMPNVISLEATCPAKTHFGYFERFAVMETLIATLKYHNNNGGTYIVMTPSHIYTGCLMRGMRDLGSGPSRQPQVAWQLDFEQPLLASDSAGGILNSVFDWINRQVQPPEPLVASGIPSSVSMTQSLATGAGMPVATPLGGAAIPAPPLTTGVVAPPVTSLPPFQLPNSLQNFSISTSGSLPPFQFPSFQ